MTRPTWDHTWLGVAQAMAERSRCPTGVGCVVVDSQQRVVATGYAGPPASYATFDPDGDGSEIESCTRYCGRRLLPREDRDLAYRDCPSVHAELNALMFSDRTRVEGGTMYVSSSVCVTCMKPVGNSGVRRVVWLLGGTDTDRDTMTAVTYLGQCGITVNVFTSLEFA